MKNNQSLIELKADNTELLKLANEKCDKKEMLDLIPNIDIRGTATQVVKDETAIILKTIQDL